MAKAILRSLKLNLAKFNEPHLLLQILKAAREMPAISCTHVQQNSRCRPWNPKLSRGVGWTSTPQMDRHREEIEQRLSFWRGDGGMANLALGCKVLSELLVISSYGAHSIDQTGQF